MNQDAKTSTSLELKTPTSSFGALTMMEDMDLVTSASLDNRLLTLEESKNLNASMGKISKDKP